MENDAGLFLLAVTEKRGGRGLPGTEPPPATKMEETAPNKKDFGFFAVDFSVSKAAPVVFETSFCSYKNIPRFFRGIFFCCFIFFPQCAAG